MKILFLASEALPFASTGGLGDVIGSLPSALQEKGVEVRVMLPLYSVIPDTFRKRMKKVCDFKVHLAWRELYCGILSLEEKGVTYYFADNEYYFKRHSLYGEYDDGERFAFFSMAALEAMHHLDFYPDILHAHDWQTALSVVYLGRYYKWRQEYSGIKTVFTIHNIEYQGKYDRAILGDVFSLDEGQLMEQDGCINLMKGAIEACDRVTTVSPRYAEEIKTDEFSHGLTSILQKNAWKLSGILNGIDYDYYRPDKPKKDSKRALQRELGLPEKEVPLLSVVSRLVSHKGIDLVCDTLYPLLSEKELQFVVLGEGESRFECFFRALEESFPHKVRTLITFDRELSRRIYSASDIFLMPSRSEPCGLSQMIASRYGAIPIVRETGGLFDSIKPYYEENGKIHGNGFTFFDYNSGALRYQIDSALALLNSYKKDELIKRITDTDFSWKRSAERYLALFMEVK